MVYLDLFSGIGGFAKGFMEAGAKFSRHYYSEIDKHATAVYRYRFPQAEHLGDIRNITRSSLKGRPDIITFGFPCQDLSVAGKGRGLDGERSGLFFEAVRLIKEFEPRVFIFENVKGLLSNNGGRDFETVLRTIADIGLYECEWQLLNTAWVLPQNRERVFFIGHLRGASRPEVFPFTEGDSGFDQVREGSQGKENFAWALRGRDCNDGTNVVMVDSSHKNEGLRYYEDISSTINARDYKEPKIIVQPVLTPDRQDKRQNGRRFKEVGEPTFTLTDQDRHGVMIQKSRGYNKGGEKSICPTISSNSFENNNFIDDNIIRRLTETECERLQGFPDNWTKFGDYDGTVKETSMSQRYRMLGNAVTVDMARIIAERLTILKQK